MRRQYYTLAVIAIASLAAGYLLNRYVIQPGIVQVEQVQKFRTDFAVRCFQRGGRIIDLGKSSVSRVCVDPDGRWLEWY